MLVLLLVLVCFVVVVVVVVVVEVPCRRRVAPISVAHEIPAVPPLISTAAHILAKSDRKRRPTRGEGVACRLLLLHSGAPSLPWR